MAQHLFAIKSHQQVKNGSPRTRSNLLPYSVAVQEFFGLASESRLAHLNVPWIMRSWLVSMPIGRACEQRHSQVCIVLVGATRPVLGREGAFREDSKVAGLVLATGMLESRKLWSRRARNAAGSSKDFAASTRLYVLAFGLRDSAHQKLTLFRCFAFALRSPGN